MRHICVHFELNTLEFPLGIIKWESTNHASSCEEWSWKAGQFMKEYIVSGGDAYGDDDLCKC